MKKQILTSLLILCVAMTGMAQKEKAAYKVITHSTQRQSGGGSHNATSLVNAGCSCNILLDSTFSVVPFDGNDGLCNGCPGLPPDYRNDDSYTGTPVSLPFNFCFYGQTYNQVYINNNGNISFGSYYSDYTSVPFPDSTYSMIAPFWGDVDTEDPGSGIVYYKVTSTAMIVKWDSVGYYNMNSDKLNTFQLIISNGSDPLIPNGNNVSFCYTDMQWTAGDVSGGTDGLGGNPATVGMNKGDGINYIQLGTFDTSGTAYNGPYGNPSGVQWLNNQVFNFNACAGGSNIAPIANGLSVCDTVRVCVGDTLNIPVNFLSPEDSQITSVTIMTNPGLLGWTVTTDSSGNPAVVVAQLIANAANQGLDTITFTATDDGSPPATTVIDLVIFIDSTCSVLQVPSANFTVSTSHICENDCVNFTDLSTNATSWHWIFPGGIPSQSTDENPQNICYPASGPYNVTLIATNTGGNDTLTLTNYMTVYAAPPTPTITQGHDTLYCSTDPTYTSYQWYADSTLIHGATTSFIVVSHSGNYSVDVTNENGCHIAVGINIVIGIEEFMNSGLPFTISPNPATDLLILTMNPKFEKGSQYFNIYNTLGMKIYVNELQTSNLKPQTIINISSLASGIYFIEAVNEHGRWIRKFVKE